MYGPSFMQIGDNPKQESEKVGFKVFAILRKKKKKKKSTGSGCGQSQSDLAPFRESGVQGF